MLLSFVAHPQMQKCLQTLQKCCSLAWRAVPAQWPLATGIWPTLAGMMELSVLTAHGKQPLNSGAFIPVCARGHTGSNNSCISGYIKWPFSPLLLPLCVLILVFHDSLFILPYVSICILFSLHDTHIDYDGLECDKSSAHIHARSVCVLLIYLLKMGALEQCVTFMLFKKKVLCQCSLRNPVKICYFVLWITTLSQHKNLCANTQRRSRALLLHEKEEQAEMGKRKPQWERIGARSRLKRRSGIWQGSIKQPVKFHPQYSDELRQKRVNGHQPATAPAKI